MPFQTSQPLEDFSRKDGADICTLNHIQQLFTSFLFTPTAVSTQLGHFGEPDNARNCKILIHLSCDRSICRYDKVNNHLTFVVRAYLNGHILIRCRGRQDAARACVPFPLAKYQLSLYLRFRTVSALQR